MEWKFEITENGNFPVALKNNLKIVLKYITWVNVLSYISSEFAVNLIRRLIPLSCLYQIYGTRAMALPYYKCLPINLRPCLDDNSATKNGKWKTTENAANAMWMCLDTFLLGWSRSPDGYSLPLIIHMCEWGCDVTVSTKYVFYHFTQWQ